MSNDPDIVEEKSTHRDPIISLRNRVFNVPLLQQPELLAYFKELDALIKSDTALLMSCSTFVERYLSDAIAEVAANITHGRTVYERDSEPKEEESATEDDVQDIPQTGASPSALFKRTSDIKFIESGINLMNILCLSGSSQKYKKDTVALLSELRFARKVYEDMIDTFLYITKDYVETTSKYLALHSKIYESPTASTQAITAAIDLAKLDDQLKLTEQLVGVNRTRLYHICLSIRTSKKKYLQIREKIIAPYLRVAYKESKSKSSSTEQFLENFQNGSAGLMRAVSCYSTTRKVGFAAYAKWWVKQSILVYIKEDANFVKLPSSIWQAYTWIEKVKDKAIAEFGEVSQEKLSELTGYSESKLSNIYDSVKTSQVYSLDYVVDDDQKTKLGDVLVSTKEEDYAREAENNQDISSRLNDLSPTEQLVTYLSFGMFEHIPRKRELTDAEIFRETLRQVIAKQKLHS